jgi:hypothetical protein
MFALLCCICGVNFTGYVLPKSVPILVTTNGSYLSNEAMIYFVNDVNVHV